MDSSDTLYGDCSGTNFFDDFMNTSSEGNPLLPEEKSTLNQQPLDILQQSLKAADIYQTTTTNDELVFDEFGLSFNSNPYNNNNNSATGLQYSTQSTQVLQNDENFFDTSQFLNVSSNSEQTKSAQLTQSSNNANQGTVVYDDTFQLSPSIGNLSSSQIGEATQSKSSAIPAQQHSASIPHSMPMPSNQQLNAGNVPRHTQVQNFQLQIPASQSVMLSRQGESKATNDSAHVFQNVQYVASGSQSVTQYNNTSYSVCTGNTLQSNSISICGVSFTRPINQTVTAPVVISVNTSLPTMQNSMALKQKHTVMLPVSVNNTTPAQHVVMSNQQRKPVSIAATTAQQTAKTSMSVQQEKINKLALLLQSKAAQQAGPGNAAVLRWGSSNINISDPTVARALAIKILEKHQARKLTQEASSSQLVHTLNLGSASTAINTTNMQLNAIVPSNSLQATAPLKAQYFTTSTKPQTSIQNNHMTQPGLIKMASQLGNSLGNAAQVKTTPVVQIAVSKTNSPVPINRFQIVSSVNIPLTAGQVQTPSSPALSQPGLSLQAKTHNSGLIKITVPQSLATASISQAKVSPATTNTTPVSSALIQHLNSNLKLKLPPQKINSLTKEQLQRLIIQHQAAVRARNETAQITKTQIMTVNNTASALKTKVLQNIEQKENFETKPASMKSLGNIVPLRVDPSLTIKQAEEVQRIISQNIPISKVSAAALSKEQRQLLTVFRAQLQAMDTPIQQYYIKNPHLIIQKVLQHLQKGKPFILNIKSETLNSILPKSTSVPPRSATLNANDQHPTISLSGDPQKSRIQGIKVNRSLTPTPQKQNTLKRPAPEPVNALASSVALSPVKRPSMIIEQLNNHREMTISPDTSTGFVTMRDASRRLLPYHIYNMPEIDQKAFEESEPIFDKVSERLSTKMCSMFAKYHTLCLKETTRDCCSADEVMLERTFLHHERSQLIEMKQKIKADPTALQSYISLDLKNQSKELLSCLYDQVITQNKKTRNESLLAPENRKISQHSTDSFDYNSPNSFSSTKSNGGNSMPTYESVEYEVMTMEPENDVLLQEAVESILT
ncbi:unnamed protein product [Clavelina lepadiformis]|uniref:GLTSCR protein conserved domain-containing protein n=1 Tax=Clavelina lepadiformis TaxID=159417 RepID=A0ABP0FET8_CLALP